MFLYNKSPGMNQKYYQHCTSIFANVRKSRSLVTMVTNRTCTIENKRMLNLTSPAN